MVKEYRELPQLPGLSVPMSAAVYDAVKNGYHVHHYRSRTAAALKRRGYVWQEEGISFYSYPTDKAKAAVKAAELKGCEE